MTDALLERILTPHSFAVIAISYGVDDDSKQRKRIESEVDTFLHINTLSDREAAISVANNRVHILVDLMAHTRGARLALAASKPAPIVVNYLGYPGTQGSSYTNYLLTDKIVSPPTESLAFSEKLAFLPHTYQGNDFPLTVDFCGGGQSNELDEIGLLVAQAIDEDDHDHDSENPRKAFTCQTYGRKRHGLPDGAFVFANFNTIDKVEPQSFSTWLKILKRSPLSSVLWLLKPKLPGGATVVDNLQREAAARGITADRIIFAERMPKFKHLERYKYVDLFLDTFVYNAHSTASDALWGR